MNTDVTKLPSALLEIRSLAVYASLLVTQPRKGVMALRERSSVSAALLDELEEKLPKDDRRLTTDDVEELATFPALKAVASVLRWALTQHDLHEGLVVHAQWKKEPSMGRRTTLTVV